MTGPTAGVMGNSLRDQLIQAGFKPARRRQKSVKKSDGIDLAKAYRLKAREEGKGTAASKQRRQKEDERRRRLNAKIRALVEPQALNTADADRVRNFHDKGRIRMVRVTEAQLDALNRGELGLVYLSGRYFLLKRSVVDQVKALSAEHVPDLASQASDHDDGEHPVPDDLVW